MGAFVHGPQRLLHPLRRTGPKGSGTVRTHHVGCGAGRDPCAHQRGDRPLGSAGGDAAELCRAARHAGRRQHVGALLPQARRDAALSPLDVRRRAQRGMERDLRRRSRLPAGVRRAREAERRVGQQRDRHQPARRALHPPGHAQGWPAGGGRSAAHQDRRAGRPASGAAARYRHAAGLGAGSGTGTHRRARCSVHRTSTCWAFEEFMQQARAVAGGACRGGVRLAEDDRSSLFAAMAGRGGSAGVRARQRTGARTQWRQLAFAR